jgi:hypothetical protein
MSTTQTPRPFYKFPKSLSAEESHPPTNGFETSPPVNNNSNEKINKEQLIPKRSAPPPPKIAQKIVQMSASGLNGSLSNPSGKGRGPKKPTSLGPPPKPSRSPNDPVLARSPSAGSGQKPGFSSETPTSPKYSASGYSSLKGAPAINVHGEPIQPSTNEKDGSKSLKFLGNFFSGKYCFLCSLFLITKISFF